MKNLGFSSPVRLIGICPRYQTSSGSLREDIVDLEAEVGKAAAPRVEVGVLGALCPHGDRRKLALSQLFLADPGSV